MLLRSPLHPLASDSLLLLSFTGAKTGTEYTTPVGYRVRDGTWIVTTQSPWWRNLKGGEPVSDVFQEFIERHGLSATRPLGIRVHRDREPPLDELDAGVPGTVARETGLTEGEPPVRH